MSRESDRWPAEITSLKHTDPWDLLSKGDLVELKITSPGKTSDSNSSRGCAWQNRQVAVLVVIRPHQGIDAVVSSKHQGGKKVRPIKINGREAKQKRLVKGGCEASVRVTDKSRVDILAELRDDSKSCAGARQVARLVSEM